MEKRGKNPFIGILVNSEKNFYKVYKPCKEAVEKSGAIPIAVFPVKNCLKKIMKLINGFLIPGSVLDIHPKFYGDSVKYNINTIPYEKAMFEIELLHIAYKKNIPIMGICGGMQMINVAFGGTLWQHIKNHKNKSHFISVLKKSILHKILKKTRTNVNSLHHQAVKRLANYFRISAISDDGIPEAIECYNRNFIIGVQWHPERIFNKDKLSKDLFRGFIDKC